MNAAERLHYAAKMAEGIGPDKDRPAENPGEWYARQDDRAARAVAARYALEGARELLPPRYRADLTELLLRVERTIEDARYVGD